MEAIEWVLSRPEPYLFINAPTGSGKTLLLGTLGMLLGNSWTYAVHTIMLQNQVTNTWPELPVLTGRANHPCLIGEETHGRGVEVTAREGICAVGEWCEYGLRAPESDRDIARQGNHLSRVSEGLEPELCSYYERRRAALGSKYRTANYAFTLADSRSLFEGRTTDTLLADEGHAVESAVCNHVSMRLYRPTYRRFRLRLPSVANLSEWVEWATAALAQLPERQRGRTKPDLGLKTVREQLNAIKNLPPHAQDEWVIEQERDTVSFNPLWGAPFVRAKLLGHGDVGTGIDPEGGVQRGVFTSATLMGADFIADLLGLPSGSWAYLDLPSTFPVEQRPVYYAPAMKMNYKVNTPELRRPMMEAIDKLIERYTILGRPWGLVHAVSNRFRDQILTESRWRGIMKMDREAHERDVEAGKPSVLVAANLTEGWDGVDDLCRFVIMPKVPYPNLGDQRVKRRMEIDRRTYDHAALVAVVQGAGRGVRHREDYADTWILDGNWEQLFRRRKDWLPTSFLEAYQKVREV